MQINSLQQVVLPFQGEYFTGNPIQISIEPEHSARQFKYWFDALQKVYYPDKHLQFDSKQAAHLVAVFGNETELDNFVFSTLIKQDLIVRYADNIKQIRLLNSNGITVFSERLTSSVDHQNNHIRINCANLSKGVYFLLLQQPFEQFSFKLIKL